MVNPVTSAKVATNGGEDVAGIQTQPPQDEWKHRSTLGLRQGATPTITGSKTLFMKLSIRRNESRRFMY
jgi:hypothetical protein